MWTRYEYEFDALASQWQGPDPFHYVPVPADVTVEVRTVAASVTSRWGMIPATVRIGTSAWTTSLWPRDGGFVIPLNETVRRSEAIDVGEVVTVEIIVRVSEPLDQRTDESTDVDDVDETYDADAEYDDADDESVDGDDVDETYDADAEYDVDDESVDVGDVDETYEADGEYDETDADVVDHGTGDDPVVVAAIAAANPAVVGDPEEDDNFTVVDTAEVNEPLDANDESQRGDGRATKEGATSRPTPPVRIAAATALTHSHDDTVTAGTASTKTEPANTVMSDTAVDDEYDDEPVQDGTIAITRPPDVAATSLFADEVDDDPHDAGGDQEENGGAVDIAAGDDTVAIAQAPTAANALFTDEYDDEHELDDTVAVTRAATINEVDVDVDSDVEAKVVDGADEEYDDEQDDEDEHDETIAVARTAVISDEHDVDGAVDDDDAGYDEVDGTVALARTTAVSESVVVTDDEDDEYEYEYVYIDDDELDDDDDGEYEYVYVDEDGNEYEYVDDDE